MKEFRCKNCNMYLGEMEKGKIKNAIGSVESGNSEILKRVGKNQTKEQIRDAVEMCQINGVKTKGFFILGLLRTGVKTASTSFAGNCVCRLVCPNGM